MPLSMRGFVSSGKPSPAPARRLLGRSTSERHAPSAGASPKVTWSALGYGSARRLSFLGGLTLWLFFTTLGPASGQSPTSDDAISSDKEPGYRVLLLYTGPRLMPAIVAADGAV